MSTVEAAAELGMSDRQVRRLVDAGHIHAERVAGRFAIYEKQVFAYKRARTKGRKWSDSTRFAALDLLSGLDTQKVQGSQKSRLKARIRESPSSALANQILADNVVIYDAADRRDEPNNALAEDLGLVGSLTKVLVASNSKREAAKQRFVRNPNGQVLVIEGADCHRKALEALALYSYGDTRERVAAEQWLQGRQAEV